MRCTVCAAVLILSASAASADDREAAKKLSAEGLELARGQQFEAAIEKFKAADALSPSAANDCNVALSYKRLERWPRAELFVQRCKRRWVRNKTGPLPGWVAKGHGEIAEKLKQGDYGRLRLTTTPNGARVYASTFAEDEWIEAPAVIWVKLGEVTLRGELDGYLTTSQKVTATAGEQSVSIELEKPAPIEPPKEPIEKEPIEKPIEKEPTVVTPPGIAESTTKPNRTIGWIVFGSGVGLASLGGVFHGLAVSKKSDAEDFGPGPEFDDRNSTFKTYRAATVGLYAAGAVAAGVGAYLLLRPAEGTQIGAGVTGEGASVSARWTF